MHKIAIRKSKVNWLEIINMALNREGWGKTYTIYTYDDVTVQATLDEYNFRYQKGSFYIEIIYTFNNRKTSRVIWVHYRTKNFDVKEFARYMKRRIITLLKEIHYFETKATAELKYHELLTRKWNVKPEDYKTMGFEDQYNSIMEIDEDFREEMLDALTETVANKMNMPYKAAVAKFCETLIPMPNIVALRDIIADELSKEELQDD